MAPAAGFLARLTLTNYATNTSVFYSFRRVSVRGTVGIGEVTGSEGVAGNPLNPVLSPGSEANIPLLVGAELTIEQASFDPNLNLFVNPTGFVLGAYFSVRYFPVGRTGVSFFVGSGVVSAIDLSSDISALSPVNVTLKSDGAFNWPNV